MEKKSSFWGTVLDFFSSFTKDMSPEQKIATVKVVGGGLGIVGIIHSVNCIFHTSVPGSNEIPTSVREPDETAAKTPEDEKTPENTGDGKNSEKVESAEGSANT